MNEFMKIVLSLSVSGTLLLLLIFGLKPLYKNKFSRRWQYYIWTIVALRFLLPFTPDTTIVGSLFEKFDTAATIEIPPIPNAPVHQNIENNEIEPVQVHKDITATTMRDPFSIYVCLFFIWSALALVLFVRKITIYQDFIQYIKAGNMEISDMKSLNLLSDCQEKLNIKTRVELSHNSLITSPMIIGFFRPNIVLPAHELEDKELSYIFVHELIHYKQKDMFYKWLIQIVVCVHWFNPFVYLLEKEVNKSCELSCDEKVISILGNKAKREYGDMLISFLKSNNLYKSSLASVTLTEGAEQLKERLGAIIKFKKKSKCVIAVTAIFSIFVCVCFFVTGAYAASSTTNDNSVWQDDEKRNEVSIETDSNKNDKETDSLNNFDNNSDVPLKDQNIGKSVRRTKEELSDELREIINSCDTGTWYVIERAGYQYIYFGGLPYNYAYQPEIYADCDSGTVNIFDVGTSIGSTGYVLLEIQQNVSLTINYNGTQIAYTQL